MKMKKKKIRQIADLNHLHSFLFILGLFFCFVSDIPFFPHIHKMSETDRCPIVVFNCHFRTSRVIHVFHTRDIIEF